MNEQRIVKLTGIVDNLISEVSSLSTRTKDFEATSLRLGNIIKTCENELLLLRSDLKGDREQSFRLDQIGTALNGAKDSYEEKQKVIGTKLKNKQAAAQRTPEEIQMQKNREESEKLLQSQASYQATILQDRNLLIHELYQNTVLANEMTEDMNHLLNAQTDTLRIAEDNAFMASQRIGGGADDLATAEKHTRRSKKLTCFLLILALVILLIAGGVIAFTIIWMNRKKK
ncbi:hypothetical protein BLNAU_22849 [Blattamonas nauphoetae]|uniref:t-SNARE coiled-coil homology domain-containing protein n=1 Tax=Blattamonas nauphoetae TaxID=2049346 RepID=A0ABQ9WRX4_9EUKA|nr:hypothetical protein BLNAU_22849 [Blattamonas nauphoetae]